MQQTPFPRNVFLQVNQIMGELDENGDGEIDFEEFMAMMSNQVPSVGGTLSWGGSKFVWVFPKIVVFPPKSSMLIRFSIIFTIHFRGKIPLFLVKHPYIYIYPVGRPP